MANSLGNGEAGFLRNFPADLSWKWFGRRRALSGLDVETDFCRSIITMLSSYWTANLPENRIKIKGLGDILKVLAWGQSDIFVWVLFDILSSDV